MLAPIVISDITIATFDCAAVHPLTLYRPLPPFLHLPNFIAGDTVHSGQLSYIIEPHHDTVTDYHWTKYCIYDYLPTHYAYLHSHVSCPATQSANCLGEVNILIMKEVYSFVRNICRIFVTRRLKTSDRALRDSTDKLEI